MVPTMQINLRMLLASAVTALLLAGCAQFERNAPQAAVDDDAICRAQGERGSSPYVACMKDRDAAASRGGNERIERAHRNLAEDMLNNRR